MKALYWTFLSMILLNSVSCGRPQKNIKHTNKPNDSKSSKFSEISMIEVAISTGDKLLVLEEIHKGIDLNKILDSGRTPLTYASSLGNVSIIKTLVDHGAEIDLKDRFLDFPLHLSIRNNHNQASLFLINSGANLNVVDAQQDSILITAIKAKNEELVKLLIIDENISVYQKDGKGRTVDQLIKKNKMSKIERYLKAIEFVNSNYADYSTIENAIKNQDIESLTIMVRDCEITDIVNGKNIMAFVLENVKDQKIREQMIELFLTYGLNVNGEDKDTINPFILASAKNDLGVVRLMIKFKPAINALDENAYTALSYAVENNNYAMAFLLYSHGAKAMLDANFWNRNIRVDVCRISKNIEWKYRENNPEKETYRSIRKLLGCRISYIF